MLAKIDAAIPHLLIAEGVGRAWDITHHMCDAIDLMAEFRASGEKVPETFLGRVDMLKGSAPSERYSKAAQALFLNLNRLRKAEYVRDFAAYAGQAKISPEAGGMPGAGMTQERAAREFLGIEPETGKGEKKAAAKAGAAEPPSSGRGSRSTRTAAFEKTPSKDLGEEAKGAGFPDADRRHSNTSGDRSVDAAATAVKPEDKPARAETAKDGQKQEAPLASLAARHERGPDTTPVKVVEVDPSVVPRSAKARDLAKWLKSYFEDKREVTILSTGKKVRFSNGNLEASLKRSREASHNQAYAGLSDLVRLAEFDSVENRDERHPNLNGQEVYYSALRIGESLYAVKMKFDVPSELEVRTRQERRGEKDIEDLRYKDHTLREIEIAPILYRGVGSENGGPTQTTRAIDKVSLGVLRNAVKPSRLEGGALTSVATETQRGPVVVRGADLNVPEGAGLSEYIKAAKRFHDDLKAESENGRPVINMSPEFAGKPIRFSGKGWRKNVNAGADVRKWQMFSALRAILERASYVRTETTEGRADDFTKSHWFECDVELNGEKLRSGFTLLEDVNGNLFYNLNADISRNANKKAPRSLKPNAQSWGHGTLSRQANYTPDEASIGDTDNSVNLHLLPQESAGRFLPGREAGARPLPASREALRRVVDKLNARAANGADVRLADTMSDLPAHLRKAFDGKAVEGVYDPETGTVWLVADQLGDPQRAAEVWAHETLAHHGLRALFNAGERKLLLNQLWLQMGGMGHPLIAETARRYGIDPRGDVEGRLTVMEEALAKLAERRAKGLLNAPDKAPEQSLWRRVVAAVLRAWQGLVKRLTGREGSMDAAGMERLLDSLQGYVMDGRPVEGAARTADGNAAKAKEAPTASLDSDRKAAAHAAWRQLQRDTEQWARQVEEFDPTVVIKGGRTENMTVGTTPDVLRKLGAPDVPMTMSARNLAKILSDKVDHQLPKSLVARLPAALAEPVMIFESATVSDALVVLTELTHEGRPVMVAIHPDVERQRIRVNDITSAYKRAREWFLRQMEDGRLLYQDKKKSLAWARTHRLQLPKVRKLPAKLENRLLTEADIVKPEAPAKEAPLASLRSAPGGDAREQAAAVARRLRAIAGRGVSEDVEELLRDPEQGRLIPREDLGKLERLCKLPHWIAKDHPKFAAIYNRQLRRVDERRAALLDATSRVPLLFDGDAKARLNAAEYLPAAKPAGEGAQALTY